MGLEDLIDHAMREYEQPELLNVLCMDFDDTLSDANDNAVPGAAEALARLRQGGFSVYVSSARFAPMYGELNVVRIHKLHDWMAAYGIHVDDVRLLVPAADLYIDDKGFWLSKPWDQTLPQIFDRIDPAWRNNPGARTTSVKKISISMDSIFDLHAQTLVPGASEALAQIHARGHETLISAGPFYPVPDETKPPDLSPMRDWFKQAGIYFSRMDAEKISADIYVSPRGFHFQSDWNHAVDEILWRLGRS